MRFLFTLLLLSSLTLAFSQQKITGFFPGKVSKQVEAEKQFDGYLNAKDRDTWLQFRSARPHHVGSAQGKANAEYMANLFRQWGYETEIATYNVLFPTPTFRQLEL